MGASGSPAKDPRESPTTTLGDLLYADKSRAVISEKEWAGLVRAIADGNQLALRVLYERSHRIVYTLAVRITNDRQTAEEVTVDVFHDVWRRAAGYEAAGGSVIGWIMNQTRSRAIDRLRFEQRKKRTADPTHAPLPAAAVGPGPVESLEVREQARRLREALAVLTPAEREAIEAAFFSELTYHEVAVKLEQPLGTIKTRVRSGLGKLRQALEGGQCP
jgi:RNA polymerase sigma-70 factor, ECF subfamily